jgi:hypothetical protein
MRIVGDVAKELLGMFLADARLTKTILILVAVVAAIAAALNPILGGAMLLLGSLHAVVEAAVREARRPKPSPSRDRQAP